MEKELISGGGWVGGQGLSGSVHKDNDLLPSRRAVHGASVYRLPFDGLRVRQDAELLPPVNRLSEGATHFGYGKEGQRLRVPFVFHGGLPLPLNRTRPACPQA